ncbi:hypothetical protein SteCoe_23106 [Stentor coeruleus]|uniref:PPM-type phosphatase domain-containing protein n=1 Tax=Stentor coeruleus TaxID=5963 RepID=A0A1R2BKL9_9CILI|nr:hypothetical protein SteCoe_23106 [Stentor coeruleus]
MGSCSSLIRPSPQARLSKSIYTYPRVCTVKIKCKEDTINSPCTPFNFILTDPIHLRSENSLIENLEIISSQCILPGIDPRGEYFKKCQDSCLILSNPNSMFIALFDGHGSEGNAVVDFCSLYVEKCYLSNWKSPFPEAEQFLKELTENCDRDLTKIDSKINASYSGATAIFMLIFDGWVYTASVGDSRGILATTSSLPPIVPFVPRIDNEIISELKASRTTQIDSSLHFLQLTKDQKPEDPEEFKRIIDSGGRVKRLLDEDGNKIGPYRIWETDANVPGLTMTRSIGDTEAKNLGVISTPIITKHHINLKDDLFIVVASDGIWHCMDNEDVINFIEYYRPISCKEIIRHKDSEVSTSNSCIAQLICEEARVRWLSIVELDDVMIDDISCVVLEFPYRKRKNYVKAVTNPNRVEGVERKISCMIPEEKVKYLKSPTIKQTRMSDPRRGSHITEFPDMPV